jgi:UDP-N-acetyl-D-mannosaminuronic acid dehydrogenase
MTTICVLGLGYVGLPTAAVLAARGCDVIGVDVRPSVVDTINDGRIHIVEPELDLLVHAAVQGGRLRASLTPAPADAFIIAVPTPFMEGHRPDLRCIQAAVQAMAPVLRSGNLVILESTSPVGTTEQIVAWLAAARPDLRFPDPHSEATESDLRVAYCPERVLPGRIIHELVTNDRVIGGLTPRCAAAASALYRIFVQAECIQTDARTAEMCKLAENSFRDVNIAFANELSMVCDRMGIDVWRLIQLANRHPRVKILQPGCGVGGHCIAVDPWFIVDAAPHEARLIRTAREVNDRKPQWVLEQVETAVAKLQRDDGRPPRIACLGITFKPDVDDLRESPALHIATSLAQRFPGLISVVEPLVDGLPAQLAQAGARHVSLEAACGESDILVILVAHTVFRHADAVRQTAGVIIDICHGFERQR